MNEKQLVEASALTATQSKLDTMTMYCEALISCLPNIADEQRFCDQEFTFGDIRAALAKRMEAP